MLRFKYGLALLVVSFLLHGIALAASGSLATNVITDGGCEGAFFDVTALSQDIQILGFEATVVGTVNARVYYKSGTFHGAENNAGAWALLGSQTVAGGSGFISTLYPINVGGVVIPAGQTYGFLIYTGTSGGSGTLATRYRTNTSLTVSNADIAIATGSGSCGGDPSTPFDGIYADRTFNGVVHYSDAAANIDIGFLDGRINRFDNGAPFAVYPHQNGGGETGLIFYNTYADSPHLLVVDAEEIAAVPEHPETNTLIAASEDGRVSLYRLTDGKFQAQGPTYNGKTYVMIFDEITRGSVYTSFE